MAKRKNVQLDIDAANISRIVPLRLANVGINKISKELNLTGHYVTKILDTPEFRAKLRDVADEATALAANSWKNSISNLVPEAVEVLKQALEKGDLEAVKLIVRSLGIEKQEAHVQQGNITVVLPDFSENKQVDTIVLPNDSEIRHIDIEETND